MKNLVKCPFCHGKGRIDPLKGYDWEGLLRHWVKIGLTLVDNVTLSIKSKPKKGGRKHG